MTLTHAITESVKLLDEAIELVASDERFATKNVLRFVHTIKCNLSYFGFPEITKSASEFESFLAPHFALEHYPKELRLDVLEKITELQFSIEKHRPHIKIVPTPEKNLFEDFSQLYSKIATDLAVKLGKKIRVQVDVPHLPLPDAEWEELLMQFSHFISNSADHGIETEEERIKAGKDAVGTIRISFEVLSTELKVRLSDDGRGVDWKKLAAKDPKIQTEEDALREILLGGISSKTVVSAISGRGVGLSAIVAVVKSWQGKVTITRSTIQGFELEVRVPLPQLMKKAA